jgi:hypothetical protein
MPVRPLSGHRRLGAVTCTLHRDPVRSTDCQPGAVRSARRCYQGCEWVVLSSLTSHKPYQGLRLWQLQLKHSLAALTVDVKGGVALENWLRTVFFVAG